MNRSLAGFLVFLLVLVMAGLVGTWILGPNLVGLAIDEERRDAPYYLLNFVAGEIAPERQASYRSDLAKLVVDDGGQVRIGPVGDSHDRWREELRVPGNDSVPMYRVGAVEDVGNLGTGPPAEGRLLVQHRGHPPLGVEARLGSEDRLEVRLRGDLVQRGNPRIVHVLEKHREPTLRRTDHLV